MSETEPVRDSEDYQPEVADHETGLDLFTPGTPTSKRKRYWLHFTIYIVLFSFTVWSVFIPFNRVTPYILGLPFNMFWDSLVLAIVAVNTYLLYRVDEGLFFAKNDTEEGV